MTKSKSSTSSIAAPSIFVIQLVNCEQFLNDCDHLLLKCKHRCNHKG